VLAALRQLYQCHGYLSYGLIEKTRGLPHVALLVTMFGSLEQVYRLVLGKDQWPPDRMAQSCVRRLNAELLQQVCDYITEAGHVWAPAAQKNVLLIDRTWTLRVAVASCVCKGSYWGWRVPVRDAHCDFVVCGLRGKHEDQLRHVALLVVDNSGRQYRWVNEERGLFSEGWWLRLTCAACSGYIRSCPRCG
jgi:hypothetical protein